jgi:hypothetical protein
MDIFTGIIHFSLGGRIFEGRSASELAFDRLEQGENPMLEHSTIRTGINDRL